MKISANDIRKASIARRSVGSDLTSIPGRPPMNRERSLFGVFRPEGLKSCPVTRGFLLLEIAFSIFTALTVIHSRRHSFYSKEISAVKLLRIVCMCVCSLIVAQSARSQGLSAQLKVRESKLFGLKGERFAKFELSSRSRTTPLSSDSVNAGPYFVFLLRAVGDWSFDADFVQEELPKLVLVQNGQTLQIGWKSEIFSDSAGSSLSVGYPKTLKLNQPFTVQFGLDGTVSKGDLTVPQEYWPGFPTLTQSMQSIDKAMGEKRFHDAIATSEQLMRADSLRIFSQSRDFSSLRSHAFDGIVSESWSSYLSTVRSGNASLKERITQLDALLPQVTFVIDSLPNTSLKISPTDSTIKPLVDHAGDVLAKIKSTRDSLQRAQDDLTVRWISEGAATGKNGPQFERMIEILTYALSSIDFADTSVHPLVFSIPQEMQNLLQKNNLQESYDIFLRQANERFQKKLPLLPTGFLSNLQKDTASFQLPYYQMLRAIHEYTSGTSASALEAIRLVFRTCYDAELSRRMDNIRVLIQLRSRPNRSDLLSLLSEASAAEKSGDKDLASDRYTAALKIAPDFAYPAFLCGKLFARTGDQIRARSFFERAYEIDSLYLSAYREAWTLYQSSSNFKAMIDVLSKALAKGNDFWETNINLGIAYLGDGNLPQAIKQFERALELSPSNYQTNVQLGLAYQTAKDYQKARDYYNKAIFIDPHRLEAVESLQKLDELQKAGH
ncbi:MAG TPA: tetratricopeptide repeat protein [Bacteroidota bacterium]|nr:tetratricopeptide repeat protein [Bacteroidota bacterium]